MERDTSKRSVWRRISINANVVSEHKSPNRLVPELYNFVSYDNAIQGYPASVFQQILLEGHNEQSMIQPDQVGMSPIKRALQSIEDPELASTTDLN